jgi:phosphopantetheine adenylyltransferase
MKAFELFKAGKHTSASGSTLDFSEADLQAAVAAYDPAVHEAPIVIGHPKENGPAWGWVKSLSYADGTISAEPIQVDEDFAEMVVKGRFKKRSASFYTPDAPNNPKPGTYYLRHVGFLGAQPPAVKGLKDVSFADDDKAVEVEFGEDSGRWAWGSLLSILRSWRETIIAKDGIEAADKVIPPYALSDIESASRTPPAATYPNFSEDGNDMKTVQQLQAELDTATASAAALTTENAALKTQVGQAANFAEQDTALKARETAVAAAELNIKRAGVDGRIEAAVKAGKLLPKAKAGVLNFAMSLADADATLEFGEGDKVKKVTQREAYLLALESGPTLVDFKERSAAADLPAAGANDPEAVAAKARAINDKRLKDGLPELSFTEAVAQVTAEIAG